MLFWLDKDVALVCALEGAEGCAMLRTLRTLKRQEDRDKCFLEEVKMIGS